jgi:D-alanyl-D-alanine-carboxypeptidase/D-alanyl-D-alanine-endopeptidase
VTGLQALADGAAAKPPAGLVLTRRGAGGEVETVTAGPVDAGAVFELGSITKAVTGLLLADAAVRGEVALDEPLAACLPGARPRASITLQELATHTAGLPRLPLGYLRRHAIRHRADPYARSTLPELLHDLARVRPRSRRRRYSNLGAALLGQALAARLGAPYEDLVHERVLGPLGVAEVWARGAPPVATPHDRRGRPVPPWTMGAYAAAGCLRGTAAGALALSLACLAPPEPMAAAVALALTPRKRRGPLQTGLGWMRSPAGRAGRMWWHNGGTGGSRAFTGFLAEGGVAVAVVTNATKSPDRVAVRVLAGR